MVRRCSEHEMLTTGITTRYVVSALARIRRRSLAPDIDADAIRPRGAAVLCPAGPRNAGSDNCFRPPGARSAGHKPAALRGAPGSISPNGVWFIGLIVGA